jgi:hypothetical protein
VAKGSSQHDKCQVGNMLWTEGSSQPDKWSGWEHAVKYLDLVHSGIGGISRPSRVVICSQMFGIELTMTVIEPNCYNDHMMITVTDTCIWISLES